MPVTVGQITSNIAKASFTVTITEEDEDGGERTYQEQVNLKYHPGRITEKTMALANAFNTLSVDDVEAIIGGFRAFNDELVRLIKWWDVLENDRETMFPLEASRLEELSFNFRGQLLMAMVEDVRPEAVAPQMNGAH
jgi:hypothetical protein